MYSLPTRTRPSSVPVTKEPTETSAGTSPKGTDFATITDEETQQVQDLLNDRPRVVLGGQTPREVLTSTITDALTA